jgi:hypothetical protein
VNGKLEHRVEENLHKSLLVRQINPNGCFSFSSSLLRNKCQDKIGNMTSVVREMPANHAVEENRNRQKPQIMKVNEKEEEDLGSSYLLRSQLGTKDVKVGAGESSSKSCIFRQQ